MERSAIAVNSAHRFFFFLRRFRLATILMEGDIEIDLRKFVNKSITSWRILFILIAGQLNCKHVITNQGKIISAMVPWRVLACTPQLILVTLLSVVAADRLIWMRVVGQRLKAGWFVHHKVCAFSQ